MRQKIYSRISAAAIAASVLSCLLIFGVMYGSFTGQMRKTVREGAQAVAAVLNAGETEPQTLASRQNAGLRLTWIAADGTVLFDDTAATENHADRPEVQSALKSGAGESARLSTTLQKQTYYYAVRLADGTVLRASSTTDSVYSMLLACVPFALMILAGITVLAFVTAGRVTNHLVEPINAIDVEHPLQNDTYDELTPLLLRIDKQKAELQKQMRVQQAMRDELADIMENMAEGLVVVSAQGNVLSVNRSALYMLERTKEDCIGKPILALHRGQEFCTLAQAAEAGENAELDFSANGHIYHISSSRAANGGSILLLVEVTARRAAEQMRREFSANVSHELKTPLQAISGYAELLTNGVVKPGDQPKFFRRIYEESQRLMTLIQDIINLSRLDEGGAKLPREQADLHVLAQETAETLAPLAESKHVTITVSGEAAPVWGVPQLLREVLYNLCENGIKYNHSEGSVTIMTARTKAGITLAVSDTGIGIPKQHQGRVFERFYRVDASRSKETGGTGLGLSIVKHAAALHNAHIELTSEENVGTTITLTFPAIS